MGEMEMVKRASIPTVGFAFVLCVVAYVCQSAEPPPEAVDPWIGSYHKHAVFHDSLSSRDGKAVRLTISKSDDGYVFGELYTGRVFHEVEKGVLSDGQGGLGKIYLGTVEYADGKKARVLRADFCYEDFVMYREFSDGVATNTASPSPK